MLGLLLSTACLPLGFGVALATGVRPLGGIVLLLMAVAAARLSHATRARQLGWLVVVLACFAASHALADVVGRWGAIAVVAAIATFAYVALLGPTALRRSAAPAG